MNLILNEGNTRAKCSVMHNNKPVFNHNVDKLTIEVIEQILERYPQISSSILCSVKNSDSTLVHYLANRFVNHVLFTHKTPIPLRNLYGTPETLAYDRMAAAIGAWHLFPKSDLMIIDAGTAVTIDFVSKRGEYLGGNISPGITTRFKALNVFAEKLPMGEITPTVPVIGKNTHEAVGAGVLNGIIAEMESYMEHNTNHKVIFTGGDAIFFAERLKNPIFVVHNLIVLGLNYVLKYSKR